MAIGEVNADSESLITEARNAYNSLNDKEKGYVTNLKVLEDAENTFNNKTYVKSEEKPVETASNNTTGTSETPAATPKKKTSGHFPTPMYTDWFLQYLTGPARDDYLNPKYEAGIKSEIAKDDKLCQSYGLEYNIHDIMTPEALEYTRSIAPTYNGVKDFYQLFERYPNSVGAGSSASLYPNMTAEEKKLYSEYCTVFPSEDDYINFVESHKAQLIWP